MSATSLLKRTRPRAYSRLRLRGSWTTGIPYFTQQSIIYKNHDRMNSTVIDKPRVYNPVPPPPPTPLSSTIHKSEQDVDYQQEDYGNGSKQVLLDAVAATAPRQNWTRKEIAAIYYQPLMELTYLAVG